jgi:hypothetical protein
MGQSAKPRYKLLVGDTKVPQCFHSPAEAMQAYLSSDEKHPARLLERKKKNWYVLKSREAYQTVNMP